MWYSYVFEIGGPIEMNVLNPLIMKFGVFSEWLQCFIFRTNQILFIYLFINKLLYYLFIYFLMQYIIN